MRGMTEDDARAALANASDGERELMAVPTAFLILDWDHMDFVAWRDPRTRDRAYLIVELDGHPTGIVLRAASGSSHARAGVCNICHTMQPADQVTMFTARRGGAAGERGDGVGTYMCADLTCHDAVRLAAPLAPGEIRGDVNHRLDGTRRRAEDFVRRVLEDA